MIRHISIILLLAFTSGLFAQKQSVAPPGLNSQKPDTSKKPRILKQFSLSSDYSEEVNNPIDTVFSLSDRNKIADKFSPVNAYPGNYGLPFYQISFFDRVNDPDKFLYNYYYPFMYVPERALFMNTQVPFTELTWSFAGPRETSEQTFRIKHLHFILLIQERNTNFILLQALITLSLSKMGELPIYPSLAIPVLQIPAMFR